jgi:hypothetical protein
MDVSRRHGAELDFLCHARRFEVKEKEEISIREP